MFCPKCRAEFREGFTHCSECDVDLVNELQVDNCQLNQEPINFKELFVTADHGQAALIKAILEAEEIPYYAQGDQINLFRIMVPIRFLVPEKYLIQAKELLNGIFS